MWLSRNAEGYNFRRVNEGREFGIRRSAAGPFVSVITLSGPVVDGATELPETG
jgi:hypothetical protein